MSASNGHSPNGYKARFNTPAQKPPSLEVNPNGIPEGLKTLVQWVNWIYQWREDNKGAGKWTKVPKDPQHRRKGSLAESTDPGTWSTFEIVHAKYREYLAS